MTSATASQQPNPGPESPTADLAAASSFRLWRRGAAGDRELPMDLLAGAAARVRLLCALLAVTALLYEALDVAAAAGIVGFPTAVPEPRLARQLLGFHGVAFAAIAASAAMYLYSRRHAAQPQRVVRAAVFFQVVGALIVSAGERMTPWLPEGGISIACLWIMTFPFVPSAPPRSAAAAYVAASMGPAGLLLGAAARHQELPSASRMVSLFLANYLAATFALAGAIVIYRLGSDVARARRLGGYQLVSRLGEGGMGEVWRARHRALVRPAAIKLMRAETLGGTQAEVHKIQERFRREVQATADLESPHTIEIYDFGAAADGRLYYVMELLRGLDLEAVVRRTGPLPSERAIHLLRQVCHSLAEAHARGLIHRDIKPSNLHVCVLGLDYDFVKVLDFGLVKVQRPKDPQVSIDGLLVGTPAYMSPEAAAGDPLDARSDLYAVGCIAFFMLTGRTVFGEKLPVLMVADHLRTPPEPPSRATKQPIPPELDALVLALLAKDPAGRPASAAALSEQLAAVPVAAPWTQERARAWWVEHHPAAAERPQFQEEQGPDDAAA
jgi:serine/threonine-protein kinase